MSSVFETLNEINVNDRKELKSYKSKKTGKVVELAYLSWAWAWGEVKKHYPDVQSKVYETPDGCIYWTDGRTCWVKTGVTIEGQEYIEYLPIMDNYNNAIPLEQVQSTDANKAIQRSITKAIARHGLGLYIYAGEDLPESEKDESSEPKKPTATEIESLKQMAVSRGLTSTNQIAALKGLRSMEDMTYDQWYAAVKELQGKEIV